MKKLIRIGFFQEFRRAPYLDPTLPRLRDHILQSAQPHESAIVSYLKNGICMSAKGGYVDDVLDSESTVPLLAHLFTDGEYLWRVDLAYYVEKYHLQLPDDFLTHMKSRNWLPPCEEEINLQLLS